MPVRPITTLRGALAGAVAAGVWAAQQPLDKRAFGVPYDDVDLLGGWITRGPSRRAAGLGLHVANGALFGALYATVRPRIALPSALRGPAAGLAEHLATWPLTAVLPRVHPDRRALPALWGSGAAFAQATWRHVLFGTVLGELERVLNGPGDEPPRMDAAAAASNGHGSAEHVVVTGLA